jgi:hypothetical protein
VPDGHSGMEENFVRTANKLIEDINVKVKRKGGLPGSFLPKAVAPRHDVMFLAEMPTNKVSVNNDEHENFNATARDRFFVDSLKTYGVVGSYVTDIAKKRNSPRRPSDKEIVEWREILLEEIIAIDPKLIIIIGKRNYYENYMPFIKQYIKKGIADDWIFHYCSQVPRNKFTRRFVEVFEKHKKMLYDI